MMIQFLSRKEQQTISLGSRLSRFLKSGDSVCLIGPLGSGKTILAKGIAKGFGIAQENVHSPTFTLMNIYQGRVPVYHFDFYRIDQSECFADLGLEDFLYGQGISIIEWADKLKEFFPQDCLEITIRHKSKQERLFVLSSRGERSQEILQRFNA